MTTGKQKVQLRLATARVLRRHRVSTRIAAEIVEALWPILHPPGSPAVARVVELFKSGLSDKEVAAAIGNNYSVYLVRRHLRNVGLMEPASKRYALVKFREREARWYWVISAREKEAKTFAEIGKNLRVSAGRARQIYEEGKRKLSVRLTTPEGKSITAETKFRVVCSNLPARAANALLRAGFGEKPLAALLEMTEAELLRYYGFSYRALYSWNAFVMQSGLIREREALLEQRGDL